ncbi:hypothetical protein FB381_2635 [Nocardioides albertanoniae]|uniref:Uncharacterized protein n=1 Tax=Nocardioides albertanoniae TaxID=1175486 RepID=A0A543A818_9ACTN|nr:hypothetical protein [Nocardioides albertanoniae]TQL68738.1 hypothetical protein FB381_2635 [Nocardioides albertanoniae]
MSEQHFDEVPAPAATSSHTGVARVDAVLETLDRLDELPLEEHVGVFETAHTELRRALDPETQAHDAMARVAGAASQQAPSQHAQPQQAQSQPTDQS